MRWKTGRLSADQSFDAFTTVDTVRDADADQQYPKAEDVLLEMAATVIAFLTIALAVNLLLVVLGV